MKDGWRMDFLTPVSSFVSTTTVVDSEPVPAVVGTATKGTCEGAMAAPSW